MESFIKIFRRFAKAFKAYGRWLGNQQARILLMIVYATLVAPFGIAVRLFSDPLHIKSRPTRWLDHEQEPVDVNWARRAS